MQFHQEPISAKPWREAKGPARILILRFHAIGDVAITLPSCVSLRNRFPNARIDFLTGRESLSVLNSVQVFDSVFEFRPGGARWIRFIRALSWGIRFTLKRYDIVLDLQRNWISRVIRWLSFPRAWSEFDRYSPMAAGERVLRTLQRAGLKDLRIVSSLPVKQSVVVNGKRKLMEAGWDGTQPVIVLNPAGLWPTRNWPIQNYVEFCRLWLEKRAVCFLLLGTERILEKGRTIEEALGSPVLNLAGQTTLEEAMGILQSSSFVLTEDSGLMHMSWTSGIPTLALFGSSSHEWSRPLGAKSRCLHSGDLPCGACMEAICRFGDVHCLARFTPAMVFNEAQAIMMKAIEGDAA